MSRHDGRGLRAIKFFRAVGEDGFELLKQMIRVYDATHPDLPHGSLANLVCDCDYERHGINARDLTLREFAQAMINQGHDRHNMLTLFPIYEINTGAGADILEDNAPKKHPTLGVVSVGLKVFHEDRGILQITQIQGGVGTLVCKHFTKNNQLTTVPLLSVSAIPEPSAGVWSYNHHVHWERYPLHIEAILEAGWLRGPTDNNDWTAEYTYTDPGALKLFINAHNRVDFHSMLETLDTLGLGNRRGVRRQLRDQSNLALSLIELEEAVCSGRRVQIQGRGTHGSGFGFGKVLFVMDDNAKIEFDNDPANSKPGEKSFVPLLKIFADSSQTFSDNDNKVVEVAVTTPIVINPKPLVYETPTPLTPSIANEYLADIYTAQWQFRPGTMWTVFPGHVAECLNALVDDSKLPNTGNPIAFISSIKPDVKIEMARALQDLGPPSWRLVNTCTDIYIDVSPSTPEFEEIRAVATTFALQFERKFDIKVKIVNTSVDVVEEDIDSRQFPETASGVTRIVVKISNVPCLLGGHKETSSQHEQVATAFLLEVPQNKQREIIISSPHPQGLAECFDLILRSVTQTTEGGATLLRLQACYFVHSPVGSYRRYAAAVTTEAQTSKPFVEFVACARKFHSSHERLIRLAVEHSHRDGKMVVVKDQGLASLVSLSRDHTQAIVQFSNKSWRYPIIATPQHHFIDISNVFCPPTTQTTNIDWSQVTSAKDSAQGKAGVSFFHFKGGGCVVVKQTDLPASELAGYRIGRSFGIDMPMAICLHDDVGEGLQLKAAIQRLHFHRASEMAGGRGSATKNNPFYVIQELQMGRDLREIMNVETKEWGVGIGVCEIVSWYCVCFLVLRMCLLLYTCD